MRAPDPAYRLLGAAARARVGDVVMNPPRVVRSLQQAINDHDLDAMVACFDPDYESDQPAHPDRSFRGREQVRKNWAQILGAVPDLETDVRRWAANGDEVWTEWEWHGASRDGSPWVMRGVIILGVRDDVVSWMRLFMEPVEESGAGVEQAVTDLISGRRVT